MTFEEWYSTYFGYDLVLHEHHYDDLKDAWEAAYQIGFNDGKDKGEGE